MLSDVVQIELDLEFVEPRNGEDLRRVFPGF